MGSVRAPGTDVKSLHPSEGFEDEARSSTRRTTPDTFLRCLLESLPHFVFILREDGTCDFSSERFSEFVGVAPEQLLGYGWTSALHPDDREVTLHQLRALTQEEQRGDGVVGELRLRRVDGTHHWFELRASRCGVTEDHWIGTLTNIHDAKCRRDESGHRDRTERTEIEAKARAAQRLGAIGQLAGGIAHDFNNILTVIDACAEEVADARTLDEGAEPVREIRLAVQRASSLTRDLLTFARRGDRQDPRFLPLRDVVTESLRMLARVVGEDVELNVEHEDTGLVHVDPNQWASVLLNLVVNARHAMPRGGRLTIRTFDEVVTQKVEQSAALPLGIGPGRYTVLEVVDTGVGLSPELVGRIFEPFFTTKNLGKGSGLGLAIIKSIVEASHAYIAVESELGAGTTFRIFVPVSRPSVVASSNAPSDSAYPVVGDETILLVEDDAPLRRAAARTLESRGFTVLEAGDGATALALLDATMIDLIITDVVLPKSSGVDLALEATRRHPGLAVILTSGYARLSEDTLPPEQRRITERFPLVPKPYAARSLIRRIRDVLDQRRHTVD